MENSQKYFKVTLKRSGAGRSENHRLTLLGLGLKRLNQVVYLRDTAAIRGMLYKVSYLLNVEPYRGEVPLSARKRHQQIKDLQVSA